MLFVNRNGLFNKSEIGFVYMLYSQSFRSHNDFFLILFIHDRISSCVCLQMHFGKEIEHIKNVFSVWFLLFQRIKKRKILKKWNKWWKCEIDKVFMYNRIYKKKEWKFENVWWRGFSTVVLFVTIIDERVV